MSRLFWGLLAMLSILPLDARSASAQVSQIERAVIGGGVGVAGGAVITLSLIVARARFQREYLEDADDLIHWQSAPMIAAPATGVVFGLAGPAALEGSIRGSTVGLVAGAGTGALLGWIVADEKEWPWAGAVMGAGIGLTVGGVLSGLHEWSRDENAEMELPRMLRFGLSLPVR